MFIGLIGLDDEIIPSVTIILTSQTSAGTLPSEMRPTVLEFPYYSTIE